MKKLPLLILSFLLPFVGMAEDIEIYLGNASVGIQPRGKVLIIFDNSGSMRTTESNVKPAYDPDSNSYGERHLSPDKNYVYFVKGTLDGSLPPIPDKAGENRRFLVDKNSCQVAKEALDTKGVFHWLFERVCFYWF